MDTTQNTNAALVTPATAQCDLKGALNINGSDIIVSIDVPAVVWNQIDVEPVILSSGLAFKNTYHNGIHTGWWLDPKLDMEIES
ncbi:unannotated protein [freshwater metagenome]|uniref:Unannotated protein n=1 Tax=freshwater metagenome TaxID=449393 RepID=A0A6J5Z8H0_9ZZZZ|nr:hypothetical protein [Actinomycetota bacterium]